MTSWAKPILNRYQTMLFSPTLDDMVPEDHPVRFYEELLLEHDWHAWEADYDLSRGQPPIHPREIAGAMLYGLNLKLTSSRQLEDACCHRIDFMWLAGGRRIDHSTFAHFRVKNEKRLRDLFKSMCRLAHKMGVLDLEMVASDGTRILADSSRHKTKSAEEIRQWLEVIEQKIAEALAEMGNHDSADDELYGAEVSPSELPPALRRLVDRKRLLEKAKEAVLTIEHRRQAKHEVSPTKIAKVPISDPDARVLENKEGGWAANYTPVVTTDSTAGLIIDAEVTNSTAEAPIQSRAVDRIEEMLGKRPGIMMGDGLYGDIENVQHVEEKGITLLTPVKPTGAGRGDIAYREDPTTPVAEQEWKQLPKGKKGRYTREAFVFNEENDCFYCPLGNRLSYDCTTTHKKSTGGKRVTRVYKNTPGECCECPLKKECIPLRQKYRRIERMEGSEVLDRVAKRMTKQENKDLFQKRMFIAETPFAHIKHNMGIRRFRLRGLKKVQTELLWICTAHNVAKLARLARSWQNALPPRQGLSRFLSLSSKAPLHLNSYLSYKYLISNIGNILNYMKYNVNNLFYSVS